MTSDSPHTLVEICLDDLAGVAVAERAGADRVELCAALSEGGITPSLGTVAGALASAERIGVNVLIRQRPGDFVYSEEEVAAMVADIAAIRALPRPTGVALGFVVGALAADGTIDEDTTARLIEACGDAPVTFHKAFDQVPDRSAALETLVSLGASRILTSGGAAGALDGSEALAELVGRADGRIAVLAGGGVRPANAAEVVRRTGVREVHLRATESVPSAAAALETLVSLGASRILTSGGAAGALDGSEALAELVGRADGRIAVLAGGGVRPANAAEVVRRTGVREVHLRATESVPSAAAALGVATAYDSGAREVTSATVVAAVVAAVRGVAA